MSNTIISGQITITIGSAPITLTTADINASPKVFALPAGETVDVNLGDLNTYLNTNFSIPAVSFPGITETNLVISKFNISSAGIFDIAVNFVFGNGQGWEIFSGFTLNEVGFEVNYAKVPVLYGASPNTGQVAEVVAITGNDLAAPTKIMFGATEAPVASITSLSATGFSVPVPAGTAAGSASITVTTADGTSNALPFTVTV
ncbi:hypothetical protein IM793_02715 [Pedobacter sp. MR2016-19]|uniref:hypothetical protein n=1 Tax=Pedobacter sp. MR2016-19 TaxID=2780089 RepID=UPI001876FFF2|nr:hypothetical protein [Pedobacter sp. MR2016-19]MBE5318058.1 hypothetical protein [Pedobacter sp. MR2016-19]